MDKAIRDRYSDAIVQAVAARYGTTPAALAALGGFESFIYRFDYGGMPAILRVTHSLRRSPEMIHGEVDWINALAAGGATVARALLSARGELVEEIDDGAGGRFLATAFAFAPGRPPWEVGWTPARTDAYGRLLGRMHALTKDYRPADPTWRREAWPAAFEAEIAGLLGGIDEPLLARYQALTRRIAAMPRGRDDYGLIHFDAHEANLHIDGDRVVLFDFDDCVYNWFIADIAIVLFYKVANHDAPERVAAGFLPGFLRGYAAENRLDPRWLAAIPHFLTTREIDLYAIIRRSYDLPEVTPAAVEAIPHDWSRRFMRGRRERLLAEQPYLDFDFSALADYL